jgi:hypothetical protein
MTPKSLGVALREVARTRSVVRAPNSSLDRRGSERHGHSRQKDRLHHARTDAESRPRRSPKVADDPKETSTAGAGPLGSKALAAPILATDSGTSVLKSERDYLVSCKDRSNYPIIADTQDQLVAHPHP